MNRPCPGEDFWEGVRDEYPRQEPLLNLNNAAVSPPPLVVQDAVIEAYRFCGHNPDYNMWSKLDSALPEAKRQLAELIDCQPGEIALNRNSTEGLCAAIFGIPLAAGDEVLLSQWEYPSVRAAWLQRQQREGIKVVTVPFGLLDGEDDVVAAYVAAIGPRSRVLQLTHMFHWNGRVLPVRELCKTARAHGVRTVVDGAQTFAQMPVSFRELGCDYFVTSLHKWLGAPVGNGMLVVRESEIDRTWPLLGPFDPYPMQIDKFDHWNLGTYNSALQAGIQPAIAFHRNIGGASVIHARLAELTRYWIAKASRIDGFEMLTPVDTPELGAVSLFRVAGLDHGRIERHLREVHSVHIKLRKVADVEGLRVSPHVYTSQEDLDRFVNALEATVANLR